MGFGWGLHAGAEVMLGTRRKASAPRGDTNAVVAMQGPRIACLPWAGVLCCRSLTGVAPPHPHRPRLVLTWQGMQGAFNKNWKRNTGLAFVAGYAIASYIWSVSKSLEEK